MFDNMKKELYFSKKQRLLKKGIEDGNIMPFDEEFYEKMSHTYISCLPVSMHIKYLKPMFGPGKCYDRSLYMFFCFPNAVLVRGDNKDLELIYGKEGAGHGWIEMDGYCYDPSLLHRFKKETYYKIYKPYNISKTTVEEYKNCCDSNRRLYEDIINTKLNDFRPNGRKRMDLFVMIPLIQVLAETKANVDLKKELDDYLKLIQYDGKEIYEERNQIFQQSFKNNLEDNSLPKGVRYEDENLEKVKAQNEELKEDISKVKGIVSKY